MEEEGRAVTFKSAKGDVSFTAKPKAKKKGKVVVETPVEEAPPESPEPPPEAPAAPETPASPPPSDTPETTQRPDVAPTAVPPGPASDARASREEVAAPQQGTGANMRSEIASYFCFHFLPRTFTATSW